jgi:hypothetical protein
MGPEKKFKSPDSMVDIRFSVSVWHNEQLKDFAKENGLTVRGLLRFMVNQSIKTGFKFIKENQLNAKKDEIR